MQQHAALQGFDGGTVTTIPEEPGPSSEQAAHSPLPSAQTQPPARLVPGLGKAMQHGDTVLASSNHLPPELCGGWGDTVKQDLQTIREGEDRPVHPDRSSHNAEDWRPPNHAVPSGAAELPPSAIPAQAFQGAARNSEALYYSSFVHSPRSQSLQYVYLLSDHFMAVVHVLFLALIFVCISLGKRSFTGVS